MGRTRKRGGAPLKASSLKAIHRQIKRLRKAKAWSQTRLGDEVGVHGTTVSHWERGKCAPRSALLSKVASALDTTIGALHEERAA